MSSHHSHQIGAASGKPVLSPVDQSKRRNLILTSIAASLVVLVVGGLLLQRKLNEPTRLNAPIDKFARFCISAAFYKMPFERQSLYIQQLDDRGEDLLAAWQTGRISAAQYRQCIELAWFGQHLKNLEVYHQLPTQEEKARMLDRVVDQRERSKNRSKAAGVLSDSDLSTTEKASLARDETQEQLIPQRWPEADRIRWIQYREAVRQHSNDRDTARRAAEKAARREAARTQPAR
jgi:hypothetical protein